MRHERRRRPRRSGAAAHGGGWPTPAKLARVWDTREEELTPLRLKELAASEARLREVRAMQAVVTLTRFTLVIRDIDLDTFAYDVDFDPPFDRESLGPMSAAERLGGLVMLHLDKLLRNGIKAGKDSETAASAVS